MQPGHLDHPIEIAFKLPHHSLSSLNLSKNKKLLSKKTSQAETLEQGLVANTFKMSPFS